MKTEMHIEELLRWRLARAEAEAPPAARAARLLELSRPWWETLPDLFQSLLDRLGKMQVAYGHAMAESHPSRSGHQVPALVVRGLEEVETYARVLYLSIRDGRLRLRFQLDGVLGPPDQSLDVTFISDSAARPLLSAPAALSVDREYRLDTELSDELAKNWEHLRVTDRMPFRWILRTAMNDG